MVITRRGLLKGFVGLGLSTVANAMTEDENMAKIWLSGDVDPEAPIKPKPKVEYEGPYHVTSDDWRAVIVDGNNRRTRTKTRYLDGELRKRGLNLEERTRLIDEFLAGDFKQIAQNRFDVAVDGTLWERIAEATKNYPEHYKNFVRAISIEESLGGQYTGETGGALGVYQIRDVVIPDAGKFDKSIKGIRVGQLNGLEDIELQTKVMVGYVKFLENYFNTSIEDNPGIILLAYNGGLIFPKHAWKLGEEDTDEMASKICSVSNMRDAIDYYLPRNKRSAARKLFGPQKGIIMKRYRKAGLLHMDNFKTNELAKAY